jgi:hypothetical protein
LGSLLFIIRSLDLNPDQTLDPNALS